MRFLLEEVVLFAGVLGEVEELHGRQALLFGDVFSGRRPTTTAGGKAEFPVTLPNGEKAADGMADKSIAAGTGRAFKDGKEVESVFAAAGLPLLSGDGF